MSFFVIFCHFLVHLFVIIFHCCHKLPLDTLLMSLPSENFRCINNVLKILRVLSDETFVVEFCGKQGLNSYCADERFIGGKCSTKCF